MVTAAVAGPLVMAGSAPDSGGAWAPTGAKMVSSASKHTVEKV